MESEISGKILKEIDGILTAIGQTDYEKFRGVMLRASTLLANLATWSATVGVMSRDDLVALVEKRPLPEQERIFRLLSGLTEALPLFGEGLVKAAQIFPLDPGGRPRSFKDRETMRQACNMVLRLIDGGKKESQAKRITAKEFGISYQTMHRTWERRTELAESSFEEFFTGFLKSLSTTEAKAIPERSPEVSTGTASVSSGFQQPKE